MRDQSWRGAALPWALVAAGILLVAVFDMTSATPFHDEWMYRWTLQHLLQTGRLRLWPQLQPLSLVQLTLALPLAAMGADPRLLRLTILPLFLCGLVGVDRAARRLGATPFWAATAAACLGCAPLVLQTQTGFLSDGPYLGLLGLGLWSGVRWLQTGRGLPVFILLGLLAASQRQVGLLVIAALLCTALYRPRDSIRPIVGLATALAAGSIAVLLLQQVTGVNSGKLGRVISGAVAHPSAAAPLGLLLAAGPVLGLLSLPMAAGLALDMGRRSSPSPWHRLPLALGLFSILGAAGLAIKFGGGFFPGDTLGQWGLGPIERMNIVGKATPYPLPIYLLLELLAMAAGIVLLVWRSRDWSAVAPGKVPLFLALVAFGQALPMLAVGVGDRYFIPVFMALLPGVAALAGGSAPAHHDGGRRKGAAGVFAVGCLVAGLVLYTVGQRDYILWHVARDQAANLARSGISPAEVDGRDEDFATHVLVPYYDRYGRFPASVTANGEALANPRRVVEFAAADDPRPGVTYGAWTRGKVVVRCLHITAPCP